MRRLTPFIPICLLACSPKPAPQAVAHRTPVVQKDAAPVPGFYRSGARLKIRWAEAPGTSTRVPIAIYDGQSGRDCSLSSKDGQHWCIPEADKEGDAESVVFLESTQQTPALPVDDGECNPLAHPASDDKELWSLNGVAGMGLGDPMGFGTSRYRLDAPRRATVWTAEGPGCVVHYEKSKHAMCVRPFRLAAQPDVVRAEERTLGRPGDASGVTVLVGSDGSVLPLPGGPEYIDAANDIRCSVDTDSDECLPLQHATIEEKPVVGAEVKASSYQRPLPKWGTQWPVKQGAPWALLAPPAEPNTGKRKVISLLAQESIVRFPLELEGTSRLVLHTRGMPDGRKVPISLYDNQLKRDCKPAKMSDGAWRCTVSLPMSCMGSERKKDGKKIDILAPSSSYCQAEKETCCKGGTVWFEATPGHGPYRFGYEAGFENGGAHPAVPEHVIRFSETPLVTDHVGGYVDTYSMPVWDAVEELDATAFVKLRVVQDP